MQYSQRDPNRDHQHGRIYRLVYTKRPLVKPVVQFDKTEWELLEQLREYEPRTRYRARRELADRPRDIVLAAVRKWVAALDPADPEFDRLRCEALWAQQRQHAVDAELLRTVLESKSPDARAAATHVVVDERDYLSDALAMLESRVNDAHPRVRVEAVRGLSFFPTMAAVNAALAVLDSPQDPWISYTLEHTLSALEPAWSDSFERGTLAADRPRTREFIGDLIARKRPGLAAQQHLKVLLNPHAADYTRDQSRDALAKLPGHRRSGRDVFRRVCASCHKVGDVGYSFGPDLGDVGKRLSRRDIIDSIIDPSKKVEPKYVATSIVTTEGTTEVGLVIEQNDDSVTLLIADGKQKKIPRDQVDEITQTNLSSMPENLAATLAPTEFLDIVEFLATRGRGD
jgi:putative heme-binding domain-containing protein